MHRVPMGGQDGLGSCVRFRNENFLHLVKVMRLGSAKWCPRETAEVRIAGVGINSFLLLDLLPQHIPPAFLPGLAPGLGY